MSASASAPASAAAPATLGAINEEAQRLLFTEARTANTFTDEPVTDEQLRAIYELAKYGPTSANINPLRILFLRSAEARERLLSRMSGGNRAKTVTAPVVAILANDHAFHERIPELLPFRPELREVFAADTALREDSARYNGALQAAYFIIAIRAVGLAAGPILGFDAAAVDAAFLTGSSWRSQLLVNIGHPGPDAWFERLPRLDYDDVTRVA